MYSNIEDKGFMLVTLTQKSHRLDMLKVSTIASMDVRALIVKGGRRGAVAGGQRAVSMCAGRGCELSHSMRHGGSDRRQGERPCVPVVAAVPTSAVLRQSAHHHHHPTPHHHLKHTDTHTHVHAHAHAHTRTHHPIPPPWYHRLQYQLQCDAAFEVKAGSKVG